MIKVKLNIDEMMRLVNPCSIEFISNICFARCCSYSSYGLGHALIMPVGNEIEHFENNFYVRGATFDEELGIIKLKSKQCPAQDCKTKLCSLHNTEFKPFGCRIMPLILKDDIISVRSFIKYYYCQRHNFPNVKKVPFYIGFKQSLIAVFGVSETERIIKEIESGNENISVSISKNNLMKLKEVKNIIRNITKISKHN